MNINKFLIEEAEGVIRRKIRDGEKKEDAIKNTKDEYELSEDEIEQIDNNLNNPEVKLETPDNKDDIDNAIIFPSQEDQDNAVGILMYKGIPWLEKGDTTPFIRFSNQNDVNQARSVLNRKWDFTTNEDKIVADILFDNIQDYKKVLEFMNKSNMLIDYDNESKLDEDSEEEDKIKNKEKLPIMRSYNAIKKQASSNPDPLKEKNCRKAIVRKRWK